MTERFVIHIDMDAFFASVELKRRPELKGEPMIVGGSGDPKSRGVVSAASYEARRFGVHSGMALKRAVKLCPKAVFLPVDFEAYEQASVELMEILGRHSRLVESFGLDEAFVELEPLEPEDGGAEDVFKRTLTAAREIKRSVTDELSLSSSVGIAPNKLLAKMASEMKKPDGFCVIKEKDVQKMLDPLAVRRLFGVGEKTEARLLSLGIKTIADLRRAPLKHIQHNFGRAAGASLHNHARGLDDSLVVAFHEPSSFSREVTFDSDTSDRHFIKETLYILTEDLVSKLKDSACLARSVTIKIRYEDFNTITRSNTSELAVKSMNDIWASVQGLLEKVEIDKKIRLVGVKVSAFEGG
ncbi:MAG: DNA polymerase IV [Deltaproteobacteria bacterium]|nr:DNA polymerase IV [Deltaproteobacteria bacterium]